MVHQLYRRILFVQTNDCPVSKGLFCGVYSLNNFLAFAMQSFCESVCQLDPLV